MTNEPVKSASVFWVGHSLIEAKGESKIGTLSLMTLVRRFAHAKKLSYDYGDHTLWGSSLSTLWNGKAHGYPRQSEEMKAKREKFQSEPTKYDTLVMTELLPIAWSSKSEFTTLYMRKFACEILKKSQNARIFLYQGWSDLQKGEDDKVFEDLTSHGKWLDAMANDRPIWQSLITAANEPKVRAPGLLSRVGFHSNSNGGCGTKLSIKMIPVADVLVALRDVLSGPSAGSFKLPSGQPFQIEHFFANPLLPPKGPADRPSKEVGSEVKWALAHPDHDHDAIHPSVVGIYIMSLVSFTAIYQQTPVGLPAVPEVGEELAAQLQGFVWQTMTKS
ncbi:MAG: hypothetical protein AAF346_02115 [Pseudomonadota bacterium]